MDSKNGFTITNRDHVLRAWQNSTELVLDCQTYAHKLKEDNKELAKQRGEQKEKRKIINP